MPRRSSASLGTLSGIRTVERLRPPRGLSAAQRGHFSALVASKPADHFQPCDLPLLVSLARHLALADAVAILLERADDVDALERAARMLARETGRIASLATKLRLTPQARYVPDSKRLHERGGGGIDAILEARRDEA